MRFKASGGAGLMNEFHNFEPAARATFLEDFQYVSDDILTLLGKNGGELVAEWKALATAAERGKFFKDLKAIISSSNQAIDIINPQSGKVFGYFFRGKYLELLTNPSIFGGNKILLTEYVTTTITGVLEDVNTLARRGENAFVVTKQGVNPGGVNILRSPLWDIIQQKHIAILNSGNKYLYWEAVRNEFWLAVNKPWLDQAILRGDKFRFVSDPFSEYSLFRHEKQVFELSPTGTKIPTIFSKEIEYLKSKGYTIMTDGTAIKI